MDTVTPLESYFDVVRNAEDTVVSVRVVGTRVGIEYLLREYLRGASPEELALRFPTVSLEQIHATITYFLAQNEEVSRYLVSAWQRQAVTDTAGAQPAETFVQDLRRRLNDARRKQARITKSNNLAAD